MHVYACICKIALHLEQPNNGSTPLFLARYTSPKSNWTSVNSNSVMKLQALTFSSKCFCTQNEIWPTQNIPLCCMSLSLLEVIFSQQMRTSAILTTTTVMRMQIVLTFLAPSCANARLDTLEMASTVKVKQQ